MLFFDSGFEAKPQYTSSLSQKPTIFRIQDLILDHMKFHCMTRQGMIYHTQKSIPGIPEYIINDAIDMMIDECIIKISETINSVNFYSNFKNKNLLQKIWMYILKMNFHCSYGELVHMFNLTREIDIADAVGIMVAENIIIKNGDSIRISAIEQKNILKY